uniref:Amine oxidase domain-containing protein n=1 Tax=Odontella aurita TaxID=265563 RepID=A0A7S4K7A5_9STRA
MPSPPGRTPPTCAKERCDVIILGAGPAGIAAARYLEEETELSTIIVEARHRVGGRTHTSDELGVGLPLDHGGKWIHGACPENCAMQLLKHYEAEEDCERETGWRRGRRTITRVVLPGELAVAPSKASLKALDKVFGVIKRLAHDSGDIGQDMSLEDLLYQEYDDCIPSDSDDDQVEPTGSHPPDQCGGTMRSDNLGHGPRNCWRRGFYRNLIKKILGESKAIVDSNKMKFHDEVMALLHLKLCQFFEGFEGSPIHELSAKHGMDGSELPGGDHNIPFGYGELFRRLAEPLVDRRIIRFGYEVISVETASVEDNVTRNVSVTCRLEGGSEEVFQATSCIVTLPLGVLRGCLEPNGTPIFRPPLPEAVTTAVRSLGIAVMNKFELAFDMRWWPEEVGRLNIGTSLYCHTPIYHPFSMFLVESASTTKNPQAPNVLVCYLTGEFAKQAELWSDNEIHGRCMKALRLANFSSMKGFAKHIPDPTYVHMTRWHSDPFSKGSWTFIAKNSGLHSMKAFRDNEECMRRNIFFAGEHTCDGSRLGLDIGCAHGAWLSGEIVAKQLT